MTKEEREGLESMLRLTNHLSTSDTTTSAERRSLRRAWSYLNKAINQEQNDAIATMFENARASQQAAGLIK